MRVQEKKIPRGIFIFRWCQIQDMDPAVYFIYKQNSGLLFVSMIIKC